MSIECSECERDLRGGHDPLCSRFRGPATEVVRAKARVSLGEWLGERRWTTRHDDLADRIDAAITEALAAQREADAKIMERLSEKLTPRGRSQGEFSGYSQACYEGAAAIRRTSEEKQDG
jgi:hypothetical protein